MAAAIGLRLNRDPELLDQLKARFAARGIAMAANNAKQADVLEDAQILPNKAGSAVGQFLETTASGPDGADDRRIVILLPGPPRELMPVFELECRHRLRVLLPERHIAKRLLRIALLPEVAGGRAIRPDLPAIYQR